MANAAQGKSLIIPIAAALAAFNLSCSGTKVVAKPDGTTASSTFTTGFRIDLDARRWCYSTCEKTNPIISISEREIVLSPYPEGPEAIWFGQKLNRESGKYESTFRAGGLVDVREGPCTVEPFTGLPTRKF